MMKTITTVSLLIFSLTALSQYSLSSRKAISDHENYELRGKVKEMSQLIINFDKSDEPIVYDTIENCVYVFNKSGNIYQMKYKFKDKIYSIREYVLDDRGKILKTLEKDENGTVESSNPMTYNEKGQLIKRPSNASFETFTYDAGGNLTEEYYDDQYIYLKSTFKYDSNGNMTEKKTFDRKGIYHHRYTYKWDEKRQMTEECAYLATDSLRERKQCIYDESGKKVEESIEHKVYNADGSIKSRYFERLRYEYDQYGNELIVKKQNPEDLSYYNRTEYQYEYDKTGNWIKQYNLGRWNEIIIREFIYY